MSNAKLSKPMSSKHEGEADADATTPVPAEDTKEEEGEEGRVLGVEDVVVEYGSATITQMRESVMTAGKVMWDGSLPCYGGTDSTGDNNKGLVECLQLIRENNSDYENIRVRQVVLIHDSDANDPENSTLSAFKDGAERLKQEQISMRHTRTNSAMDGESGFGLDETSFED